MTVMEKPRLTREHVLSLLTGMIRIRKFEDKCAELYQQQKIRGFLHLYDGEEAIAAGVMPALGPHDKIVATYREHGQALARGVPMTTVMAEMYGKAEGCSGGRGASRARPPGSRRSSWRPRSPGASTRSRRVSASARAAPAAGSRSCATGVTATPRS